jgi:transcriptional regulator of acetoin/glycerol metabolism
VRQLINAIERAKIMADDNLVRLRDLPREVVQGRTGEHRLAGVASVGDEQDGAGGAAGGNPSAGRLDDLSSIERAKVIEVLRRERGNKTRAARALGIDRRKLYRLMEKYEVKTAEWFVD